MVGDCLTLKSLVYNTGFLEGLKEPWIYPLLRLTTFVAESLIN